MSLEFYIYYGGKKYTVCTAVTKSINAVWENIVAQRGGGAPAIQIPNVRLERALST